VSLAPLRKKEYFAMLSEFGILKTIPLLREWIDDGSTIVLEGSSKLAKALTSAGYRLVEHAPLDAVVLFRPHSDRVMHWTSSLEPGAVVVTLSRGDAAHDAAQLLHLRLGDIEQQCHGGFILTSGLIRSTI
jgi:hypothetical protein